MNDLIKKYKENSPRICAVLLGLVLFLLPFEMFPRAELFGATVRLSQVAGLLLIVFSAPVIITRWRDWLKQPWLLLALFVLVSLVSSYFAISKSRGLMVSSFYIFNFVLAYAATQAFDIKNSQVYKKIIYISGLVVVTFCLFQFVGDTLGISNRLTLLDLRYTKLIFGFARVQGFSIEPLYLASYLMIPFCLALASYIFSNKKYEAAIATVFLITIYMTVARGAYLAVFTVLIGFAIFMIYQKKWQQLGVTVAIIFGSAVVAFGLIWASGSFAAQIDKNVNVPSDLQTSIPQEGIDAGGNASRLIEHTTDFADESSFSDRLKTSKTAIAAGLQNPVLGVGPGNFGRYAVKNYPGQYEDNSQIANNETFEILAEQGFVGLVIILAFGLSMLLLVVKYCSKKHSLQSNIWALASGGMLVAFVVQWQTFSTLYVTHIWVIVGVYIAVVGPASDQSRSVIPEKSGIQ